MNWHKIALAFFALFCLGMLDNARGPFYPEIIEDMKMGTQTASLFFAIPSFFSFLSSQMSGFLHIAPLVGLRWGAFSFGLGYLAIANSTEPWMLWLSCALFGIGFGLNAAYQHQLIQENASPENRRRLFSGLHSFYAFASCISPSIVSLLIANQWGWREGFSLLAWAPIVVFLFSWLLHAREPKSDSVNKKINISMREYWSISYIAFAIALYVSAELVIGTRIVLFLRVFHKVSPTQAPLYLTVFFVLLLIGRATFTFFSFEKWTHRQILIGSLLGALLSNLAGILWHPYYLSLTGLFMAPVFGVGVTYVSEVFSGIAPKALAYTVSMGSLIVVPMHFIVGSITEFYGVEKAMLVGPILLALSILLVSLHPRFMRYYHLKL